MGDNGSTYDDGTDTFITGTDPNNYVWYSGKLWRAVSVNKEAKTTKLVTQWNISAISYNPENNSSFEGSYMKDWLNDTSVDGFLGNLRNYENYIDTNSKWDATLDTADLGAMQRPTGVSVSTSAVGLLNLYEYQESYRGTTFYDGYLNNGLSWWTLTPYSANQMRFVYYIGNSYNDSITNNAYGIRPAINLKADVKIVSGSGTESDPYRLNGDNDSNLNGVKLNTRYSGEYISFGNGENNLYRIVSHENGSGTKITSVNPLKNSGKFVELAFGNDNFSTTNTIGNFLNNNYSNPSNGYLTNEQINMIEESTTWYLGFFGRGINYKLAKYADTTSDTLTANTTIAKIGLLRVGELMAGQFDINENVFDYWAITPSNLGAQKCKLSAVGVATFYNPTSNTGQGIKPAMNLKENVIIKEGTGTKIDPFTIELFS